MSHKHKYIVQSYSAKNISFVCKCGNKINRNTTKSEEKFIRAEINKLFFNSKQLFKLWHKFVKVFTKKDSAFPPVWDRDKLHNGAKKWAKKYPDQIHIVGCDDSYHSSSELILFEHKSNEQYIGVTVLFVPQCSGESPIEFFLYPNASKNLIKTLQAIQKGIAPLIKKANAIEIADSKRLNDKLLLHGSVTCKS